MMASLTAARYLLFCWLVAPWVSIAVRPAMDEEMLTIESEDAGGGGGGGAASRPLANPQPKAGLLQTHDAEGQGLGLHRVGASSRSWSHAAVSVEEVAVIGKILTVLNSDADDFEWMWDKDADFGDGVIDYQAIRCAALEPEEALVNHLLIRHGFALIYVSRSARYEDFLQYLALYTADSQQDRMSTLSSMLLTASGELKQELMKLSLPALQHLRATDIAWAQNQRTSTKGGNQQEDPDEFSTYQAGSSTKVSKLVEAVLDITWQDITAANYKYTGFLKEMDKVGRTEGVGRVALTLFSPGAIGGFVLPPAAMSLHQSSKRVEQADDYDYITSIHALVEFPDTGFAAEIDVPLLNEVDVDALLYASDEHSKTSIMQIKVEGTLTSLASQRRSLLLNPKWRDAIWPHELGQWVRWHPDFIQRTLAATSIREESESSSDADADYTAYEAAVQPPSREEGPSSDYMPYMEDYVSTKQDPLPENSLDVKQDSRLPDSLEVKHDKAAETEGIDSENDELPLSMQKIFKALNADTDDFLWEWASVSAAEMEDERLQFLNLFILDSDPAVSLAKHLMFRHGFALIYATRSRNYNAFISYLGSAKQMEGEVRFVFYARILLEFASDFFADLLSLGLEGLKHLHAADSKWCLNHAKDVDRRWKRSALAENADAQCQGFQAVRSKRAWDLIASGTLPIVNADLVKVDRAMERWNLKLGKIAREVNSITLAEALWSLKSQGELRLVTASMQMTQREDYDWDISGKIEYPVTRFVIPFWAKVSQLVGDGILAISRDEDAKKAGIAAAMKEVIRNFKRKHAELLKEYMNVPFAHEMYEGSLQYFPGWSGFLQQLKVDP